MTEYTPETPQDSTLSLPQRWADKTFEADRIWAQVKAAMDKVGLDALATTPRRPDVRLIVNNVSGKDQTFFNPGNHSDKAEVIPCKGEKTAAMVMVAGDTLIDQVTHAHQLTRRFNLATEGLSDAFVDFLKSDDCGEHVAEAYGPAPYEGQSKQLVDVQWKPREGDVFPIKPQFGQEASYGARKATEETAFIVALKLFVRGTTTVPELMEMDGMVIVPAEDWETKQETTRPIVPSIAVDFYGEHFDDMPAVIIDTEGRVQTIDLGNGDIIEVSEDGNDAVMVSKMDKLLQDAPDMPEFPAGETPSP